MLTEETTSTTTAIVRGVISYSGGLATTHYYIDGQTVHALVAALAPVVAILWSIYERKRYRPTHDRRKRPY